MTKKNVFRIAVISDLHVEASGTEESKESWLTTSTPDDTFKNPFTALKELIRTEALTADILLNCGDMTNKADFSAQKYAWQKTDELAKQLNTKLYLGTAGNHDLDSRCSNSDYDVKGSLQALNPVFPGIDVNYADKYWSRNYAISIIDNIRIVNINSCAFHGLCADKTKEYLHGRVSNNTLNRLVDELKLNNEFKINIVFFHHHPSKLENYNEVDYSEMIGGNQLIQTLADINPSNWLMIHGHKHWPNVNYEHTPSGVQIVFSAGSFSSKRLHADSMVNQFYIIEIEQDALLKYQLPIVGTVQAWNWTDREKWKISTYNEKIPYGMGFGATEAPIAMANKINAIVATNNKPFYLWNDIQDQIPTLKYMLPDSVKRTIKILEDDYQITIMRDNHVNAPFQIAKKSS